jgi:hypothetical protein
MLHKEDTICFLLNTSTAPTIPPIAAALIPSIKALMKELKNY